MNNNNPWVWIHETYHCPITNELIKENAVKAPITMVDSYQKANFNIDYSGENTWDIRFYDKLIRPEFINFDRNTDMLLIEVEDYGKDKPKANYIITPTGITVPVNRSDMMYQCVNDFKDKAPFEKLEMYFSHTTGLDYDYMFVGEKQFKDVIKACHKEYPIPLWV